MQLQVSPRHTVSAPPTPPRSPMLSGLPLRAYLILYGLLILLPVLAFASWAIDTYSRAERAATEDRARSYARDLSVSLDHELKRVADQLTTFVKSRALASGDMESLYLRLKHTSQIFKATMVIRDAAGNQLLNTRAPFRTPLPVSRIPEDARSELAAGRTHISNLYVGAVKRAHVVSVSVPIEQDGKITHSVTMALEPDTLLTVLGLTLPPEGWVARVVDRKNVIIASTHGHDALIGQPGQPISQVTLRDPGNTADIGDGIVKEDGRRLLRAYHRSPLSGWLVTVMMPVSQLEAPFTLRWQGLAAAGVLLLAMSTLLAFGLAKGLVRQFRLVADQASALARDEPLIERTSLLREANDVVASLHMARRELETRSRALEDSEAQLRAVFEGSPIGMFRADLDKNCTYANPKLCELAGIGFENMLGQGWTRSLATSVRVPLMATWDAAMRERRPFELGFEVQSLRRGRGTIHGHLHAVPEFDAGGAFIGYIGTVSDVTERKRAEADVIAERDRFKHIMLATPDVVYVHDVGSREIGFLNHTPAELLHRPDIDDRPIDLATIEEVTHPEDRPRIVAHRRAMLDAHDGEVREITIRMNVATEQSPITWLLVRNVVFARNADGSVHQVLGVVSDITAQKLAEARLAEEIDKFRGMTLASPDLVYLYDRQDRRVSFLSRSLRELLGYPPSPVLKGAEDMYEFIFPDDLESAHEHVRKMRHAKDGEVMTEESRFRGPDGTTRWLQNRSVVFSRHPDGRPHLILGIATDTTERNIASAALARSNAELEARVSVEVARREQVQREHARSQSLEAIGRLTGGVAHDFNNVLTVVMASLQLFKSRHPGVAPLALIDDALDGAATGRRLTRQLLSFAKRQSLDPVTIQLGDHLQGVVRWMKTTLSEGVEVRADIPADLGAILVDETGLDSAVINLIMNAQDALGGQGVIFIDAGNITLAGQDAGGSPAGNYVYLAISDTGQGMEPEVLQKIFEPFFTTKSMGGTTGGTGLGLSSVYGFVKQSHGRLEVRSKPGHGSCFILYFPRAKGPITWSLDRIGEEGEIRPGQGQTVLIVEDMPKVRRVIRQMVEMLGYKTLEAESGQAAIDVVKQTRAVGGRLDAVLSDVLMPGNVSGLDLAKWVQEAAPEMAIVLVSAFDEGLGAPATATDERHSRPVRKIAKPFSIGQLSRALAEELANANGPSAPEGPSAADEPH